MLHVLFPATLTGRCYLLVIDELQEGTDAKSQFLVSVKMFMSDYCILKVWRCLYTWQITSWKHTITFSLQLLLYKNYWCTNTLIKSSIHIVCLAWLLMTLFWNHLSYHLSTAQRINSSIECGAVAEVWGKLFDLIYPLF